MIVGRYGLKAEVLDWAAGEGGKIDGGVRVSGRIVAKLAVIICSPRPKVAGGVDGEGIFVASGDRPEVDAVHGGGVCQGGKVGRGGGL